MSPPPGLDTKAWLTRTDNLQGRAGADRRPSTTFDGRLPRRLTGRHAHLEKLLSLRDAIAGERLARQHTCLCCTDSVPSHAAGPGGSALILRRGEAAPGVLPKGVTSPSAVGTVCFARAVISRASGAHSREDAGRGQSPRSSLPCRQPVPHQHPGLTGAPSRGASLSKSESLETTHLTAACVQPNQKTPS